MGRPLKIGGFALLYSIVLFILAYSVVESKGKERFVSPHDPSWLYTGGIWEAAEDPSLGERMAAKHTGARASIETNSPFATLKQRGNGGEIKIYIDGKPAVTHVVPKDGEWHELPIYAHREGWHKIEVAYSAPNHEIFGLSIERGAEARRPEPAGKKIVVIGHSYPEGCCLDNKGFASFPALLGDMLDAESINAGIGRTDITVGGKNSALNRVQTDVIAFRPDYVLSVYGINAMRSINTGAMTHEQYQAEYVRFLETITNALPRTRVFASGMNALKGMTDETLAPFNEDIKKACAVVPNCTFIDLSGKWNSDNFDLYVSRDGIHPSEAGHRFLAETYAETISAAMKRERQSE